MAAWAACCCRYIIEPLCSAIEAIEVIEAIEAIEAIELKLTHDTYVDVRYEVNHFRIAPTVGGDKKTVSETNSSG